MFNRLNEDLACTNNSLESWHRTWNSYFYSRPKLSRFVARMLEEDEQWEQSITDYENRPADGVRGRGASRRLADRSKDEILCALAGEFQDRSPINYLRAISNNLHYFQ